MSHRDEQTEDVWVCDATWPINPRPTRRTGSRRRQSVVTTVGRCGSASDYFQDARGRWLRICLKHHWALKELQEIRLRPVAVDDLDDDGGTFWRFQTDEWSRIHGDDAVAEAERVIAVFDSTPRTERTEQLRSRATTAHYVLVRKRRKDLGPEFWEAEVRRLVEEHGADVVRADIVRILNGRQPKLLAQGADPQHWMQIAVLSTQVLNELD